jgi:hypothetical protein
MTEDNQNPPFRKMSQIKNKLLSTVLLYKTFLAKNKVLIWFSEQKTKNSPVEASKAFD